MTRYSVQPRNQIFVKGHEFLCFAKNISKLLVYSEKILDHAKQSATDTLNTSSKRVIQKTAEATGDFIGNKIANKIIGFSKN